MPTAVARPTAATVASAPTAPSRLAPLRRRAAALSALALLALSGVGAPGAARAHVVPTGVGSQTWIDVRPRKIVVRFNLGFSSLLAIKEMKTADGNQDGVIDAEEERAYLAQLSARLVGRLRLFRDGKPLPLTILGREAVGLRGPIMGVPFDTFYDLEAAVTPDAAEHELSFYEGNYENETAQQILYAITDHGSDFASFAAEQKAPGQIDETQPGVTIFQGRDLTVRYQLRGATIERDRAEELFEPDVRGLQRTVDALATTVARSAEKDLAPLATGEVRLGGGGQKALVAVPVGFTVSAPTAGERDGAAPGTAAEGRKLVGIVRDEESDETAKMTKAARDPFAWATLLLFVAWGFLHAKGPGHGKSMVAAYLLGTRGRVWDAVRLGLIVTFTHTFTLYTFGLGLVYLVERLKLTEASQQTVQTRALFLLTFFSGIALSLYGVFLGLGRLRAFRASERTPAGAGKAGAAPGQASGAPLPSPGATGRRLGLAAPAPVEAALVPHSHDGHSHDGHTHSHGEHGHEGHSHDGHTHTHSHSHDGMDEDAHAALHAREAATQITSFRDLLSLGISSGIVPCPAGISLIVISLTFRGHNTLKYFAYLNAFSFGLGAALVSIALLMVLSRSALERALSSKHRRAFALAPVLSAFAIALVGLAVSYEAFDPGYKNALRRLQSTFVKETTPAARPAGGSPRAG